MTTEQAEGASNQDSVSDSTPPQTRIKKLRTWISQHVLEHVGPPYHQMLWATVFFVLALFVLIAEIDAARVWPVAVLLLAGVLIASVDPNTWKDLLSRVEEVKIGNMLSVATRRDATEAAADSPEPDTGEGTEGEASESAQNMFDLRVRLEAKLTYVAKHLFPARGESPDFLTVGSLIYDGYMNETDGRLAFAILSLRQEELDELPEEARRKFISDAETFVESLRASIFWGQVKRYLQGREAAQDEDLLLEHVPTEGRRDDFLAGSREGAFRVAPALALDRDSRILTQAINRLAREGRVPGAEDRQIIVIPDRSAEPERLGEEELPRVVKLAKLRFLLEEEERRSPPRQPDS